MMLENRGLKSGDRTPDGWNFGRKKSNREVGAPPKKNQKLKTTLNKTE